MAPNDASASLLDLPSEVLDMVCRNLCTHCSRNPLSFDRPDPNEQRARHVALDSLSATCEHLRSIALPIFLHDANQFISREHMISLLGQRPDLAGFVKVVKVPQGEPPMSTAIPQEHQIIARKAVRSEDEGGQDWHNRRAGASPKEIYCELLMALCPKVETLAFHCCAYVSHLSYPLHVADTTLGNLAHRFKQLGSTPGLPSLRTLELSKDEKVWAPAGNFGILHPAVSVLLGAAPRLERLVLRWWTGLGEYEIKRALDMKAYDVGIRNLRCLEMYQACIEDRDAEYEALREMVLQAQNLETFGFSCSTWVYGGVVYNHLAPARFLQALEPRKDMLQHLELEISDALNLDEQEDPFPPQLDAQQLAKFTKLHTLTLSENTFCRHCLPDVTHIATTCLTDLLPPTVRNLTVTVWESWSCWKDILYLGRGAATGGFPTLQRNGESQG
ncbi:hypothetical protein ACJ41O_001281 [Fusarium nematophilum]